MTAVCQRKETMQGKAGRVFTANHVLTAPRVPWLLCVQYSCELCHVTHQ